MITTILLDIGGTTFIKKSDGMGTINPAIIYLNDNIPSSVHIVILSDTDAFDIPKLLQQAFPGLRYDDVYTKMIYPWIDKTKPETYSKVCEMIEKQPSECVFIDNLPEFRAAAETIGIKIYGVDIEAIKTILHLNNLQ